MHRLARYSRERLHSITNELQLDYERNDGYLVLLRSEKDLEMARPGLQMLNELGSRHTLLDGANCRRVEPGLNAETALHAGIYLPDGEVGNCRQFAYLLRSVAQHRGVQFRFHSNVTRLKAGARPSLIHTHAPPAESTVVTPNEYPESDGPLTQPMPFEPTDEPFDAIVVCAALGAQALLRPLGVRLPMAPVYGYSITAPLRHFEAQPDVGPRSAVMDERYKVAISRLGQRVRVAGSAEVGGDPRHLNPAALQTLYKALDDWFPGVVNLAQTQRWKGARPMLPDGPPVLGPSAAKGIWLNLGHGSSGWALACGSARVIADRMIGRPCAIDIEGLGFDRLR
jgi:D-amino-acid dehydrogenase